MDTYFERTLTEIGQIYRLVRRVIMLKKSKKRSGHRSLGNIDHIVAYYYRWHSKIGYSN